MLPRQKVNVAPGRKKNEGKLYKQEETAIIWAKQKENKQNRRKDYPHQKQKK